MRLYTADVKKYCAGHHAVSEAAYALARFAAADCGFGEQLEIIKESGQKPYFAAGFPHFSISHSAGRILAGVSEQPLGVDIERERELSSGLWERLFSAGMRREFSFFEGWTLRESVFKLTGRGNLRSMELQKRGDLIYTPYEGVHCRVYHTLPGFTAACADYTGHFPVQLLSISPDQFLREPFFNFQKTDAFST